MTELTAGEAVFARGQLEGRDKDPLQHSISCESCGTLPTHSVPQSFLLSKGLKEKLLPTGLLRNTSALALAAQLKYHSYLNCHG